MNKMLMNKTLMNKTFLRLTLTLGLLIASTACSSHQTVGEQIDDAVITAKIEAKLTADPEVSAFNVDVDTEDGVVRLSGVVKQKRARREAADLARNTQGVRRVINDITIGEMTASERFDDASITVKVKAKLTADPEVNPFKIDVDTDQGVVTLSGRVSSAKVKREAEQLSKSVEGVKSVHNRLKVEDH